MRFDEEPKSVWGYDRGRAGDPDLEIPDLRLRGVADTRSVALYYLVARGVKDGVVSWDDAGRARGRKRSLWWMACAARPTDVGTWKKCLAATPPSGAPAPLWRYWVAQGVFPRFDAGGDFGSLHKLASAYRAACPEVSGLLPIALMTNVCRAMDHKEQVRAWLTEERIGELLEVLIEVAEDAAPPGWLADTREWRISSLRGNRPRDLLQSFSALTDHFRKQGLITDGLHEEVRAVVSRLRALRDADRPAPAEQ